MSTSTKELADLQEQLASLIDIPESKWFTIKRDHTNVYTVQLQQLNGKFEGWLLKNLQEEMTIDKASYSLSTKSFVYAIKKCAVWATFGDRENLQEFLTEADQRMDDLYDRFLVRRLSDPASGSAAELPEKVVPTSKWCTITFDNIYQCYNVFPKISADFGEWLATHYRAKMAISVDGFCYKSDMFFDSIENDNKWCSFVQLELLQEFLAAVELRLDELYARYQQELEDKAEKLPTSKWFTIKLDEYDVNDSYDVSPNVSTEFRIWLDKNIKEEMSIEIKHCILSSWCFVDAIKRKYVWCSFSDLEELQRFLAKAEPRLDELYARYQKELAPEPPTSEWFTIERDEDDCFAVMVKVSAEFGEWLLANYQDEMDIDANGAVIESFNDAIRCKDYVYACFSNLEDLREFLAEAEPRMSKLYARYDAKSDTLSTSECKFIPTSKCCENKQQAGEEFCSEHANTLSTSECKFIPTSKCCENKQQAGEEFCSEHANTLPTSKWFDIELDGEYFVTPKVSAVFGEWLVARLEDDMFGEEFSMDISGYPWSGKGLVIALRSNTYWCKFGKLEFLQEFLAKAERRMNRLYTCYQKEQLPTSKWCTIEFRTAYKYYEVFPKISPEFGEWLATHYRSKMAIQVDCFCYKSDLFFNSIKYGNCWCRFAQLERAREFLAQAEPRMSKLYARYQIAQLPAYEWLSVKYQDGTFEVRPNVQDPAFKKWIGENHNDKLNVRKFFTIGDRDLRCCNYFPWILNSDICWFWFVGDQENLAKGLVKINECIKKLYARYSAPNGGTELQEIPASEWLSVEYKDGAFEVRPNIQDPAFAGWLTEKHKGFYKNYNDELDMRNFFSIDDDRLRDANHFPWAQNYNARWFRFVGDQETLAKVLVKIYKRIKKLYARYTATNSGTELQEIAQLPDSKWFTILSGRIKPNVSTEFGQWLLENGNLRLELDSIDAETIKTCLKNDCSFTLERWRKEELLPKLNRQLDKLHALFQLRGSPTKSDSDLQKVAVPTSRWFTIIKHAGGYEVQTNIPGGFTVWLLENCLDEIDNNKPCRELFAELSRWWFDDQRSLQEFITDADQRLDKLHARYQMQIDVANQAPTSKWFTVSRDPPTFIKPNVSSEFSQWLLVNLQSELDSAIVTTCGIKNSLQDNSAWIHCTSGTSPGEMREELPKLDQQLDKLYARFQVRGCAPASDACSAVKCVTDLLQEEQKKPPTSKWFTIEQQRNSTFYAIPSVSTEFGTWLAANLNTEMDIVTSRWTLPPSSTLVNVLKEVKPSGLFFRKLKRLRAYFAEADPRMDKLYTRYQEEQQRVLTSSKWFTVARTNITRAPDSPLYAIAPNTSKEFAEWLVDNITADEKWISGHQSLYYAFKHKTSFYLDYQELAEFLAKADQRVSELYERYQMRGCGEATPMLPTSKWFTVRGSGTSNVHDLAVSCYSILPSVSDEFGSWLLACDDHGLIVNGCGADVSATMFRNCIEHGTWVGYDNLQVLTHDLAQLDQRMDELYERYQTDAPNVEPDLHEQAAPPLSRWFGMERRPFPFSYHIKLSVSNDFNEWLTRNCTDELDIDKPNWKILTAALTGKYSSGIILSEEIVHEFLAEADPRMSKLYERYHKELAAEPPTSKWFTIETKSYREFFSYRINLAVSGDFGKWLAKNLQDELDIDKPKWRTLTPLFLDIDAFTGTGYVSFSQLENVCEFLAEADQRMEKLYERYEEQAALPLSKWFTIQHNLCYDADLQVSAEFRHWLIANLTTELDMVLPLELPFQISTRKVVRCLTENGYALFGFYKLQVLREFLAKAELRMDALYARYLAELVAPPPTSKWFTVVNEFIYRVKLAVSDDFGKWLVKNLKNELDIEKSNWTTFTWSFVVRGYLSGYVGFSGLENVREFLAEADPRMVKLYERYQTDAQKCGPDSHENAAKPPTSTCSVQKCEPGLHENAAKPPTSKWFTFDKISFLYSVKPNVSAEFRQWLVANVEKIDMDINKLHWNISSGGFVRALNTTMTISWINLYYRDLCEFLAEVEPRMEKLYELYQNELPTSKWFTVYRGSISFGHPILPTSVSPEFRQWLAKNRITELDIKAPQYTNAEISTVRGGFFWTALKIGGDEMNNFFAEVDKRMDKLYERFQAEQQEPWISIDRVEVVRVLVQAPRAFVNYCSGKTFAGVLLDWQANGKRQIQSEPPVWRSNMANLGCGLKKGTGICCQPGTIPRLQAALVEAHQAWQPDPEPGRLIIGKPPVEFEVGAPEQGYKVSYHPGLGKPSEICDSLSLRKAIAETVQVVA